MGINSERFRIMYVEDHRGTIIADPGDVGVNLVNVELTEDNTAPRDTRGK